MKTILLALSALALLAFARTSACVDDEGRAALSPMEELGKRLFFDTNLSRPAGQDCAACHGAAVGFTGPDEQLNKKSGVFEGAVKGRFSNRRPPAAAYAGDSPKFHRDASGEFVGGMFWDGRATGDELGDPLAEQALGPFLNPLEQNLPDKQTLIRVVRKSDYAGLFERVFGAGSLDADRNPESAFVQIGRAIAAYERSAEVNPFNSKFDTFWRAATAKELQVDTIAETNWIAFAKLGLTDRELRGLVLFNTKGMCANCHLLTSVNGKPPVFTDYRYDNLGVPGNPDNPFYRQDKQFNPQGVKWVDPGLGGYLETVEKYRPYAAANYGAHKTPTLRNVDLRPTPGFVKAYMHNGYFKSLKDIVHFYNARDTAGAQWPPPEIPQNVNRDEMGNLGLTEDEEDAIVLFMQTLSDRQ